MFRAGGLFLQLLLTNCYRYPCNIPGTQWRLAAVQCILTWNTRTSVHRTVTNDIPIGTIKDSFLRQYNSESSIVKRLLPTRNRWWTNNGQTSLVTLHGTIRKNNVPIIDVLSSNALSWSMALWRCQYLSNDSNYFFDIYLDESIKTVPESDAPLDQLTVSLKAMVCVFPLACQAS